MELGVLIPESDGVGDSAAEAESQVVAAQVALDNAVRHSQQLRRDYLARVELMEEERGLLQSLGLTENLYRKHIPDYSAGEGLES